MKKVLIGGVGNMFLGDDGFGVEVTRRLSSHGLPEWAHLADFGIRGIHLAYELFEYPYERAILIDAVARGGAPGTLYVLELDLEELGRQEDEAPDAHGMNLHAVFGLLKSFGKPPPPIWLVGCEPATTEERLGLSEPVQRAVDEAVTLVCNLLSEATITG